MRLIKTSLCALVFLLLAGCVPGDSGSSAQAVRPAIKKLVVWHWMNDRNLAFEALAAQYQAETGIAVEFKLFSPPDIYSQKVIAAARAGNLPDIFGILGEKKTLASFIKAGHILDLTPYMEADNKAWQERFFTQALAINVFEPGNFYNAPAGVFGVPIDITLMQFVYNKNLFKKAGLNPEQPPATLEEFINLALAVKEKTGADGFICGWGEGWLVNSVAMQWAINIMGEEKFFQTLEGKVPYTDPDWIKVFSLFKRLKESSLLSSNIATMINKESEDAFSRDKAAFSYNGTWAVNVYKQLAQNLEYGFFPIPAAVEDRPAKIWGGAGSSFMVNARSALKTEAVDFLKWMTQSRQQKLLVETTSSLPAIKGCDESLPIVLANLPKQFGALTHPNTWPVNEDSRVTETITVGLQQIVMGIATPEQVAKDIQEVKQRVLRQ